MISILRRYESNGRVYRVLDCGHEHHVLEPSGGKAPFATQVRGCQVCNVEKARPAPAPVVGTCGAIVLPMAEGRARPCGAPARGLKRGQPRCALHLRKGAA